MVREFDGARLVPFAASTRLRPTSSRRRSNRRRNGRLLAAVAGGQDFVRIDAHDEVDDLIGSDLGKPVRRIRRDDDDIARSDLAALPADDLAATGTWTVERGNHGAFGRRLLHILDGSAGHEGPAAGNDVVDLRDLAVLDAETDVTACRFGTMDDADTDVVFAVDVDDADLLIAHR